MSVAVICEFNPFHNGHAYLLSQAKKYGSVLAIMSGSFTQRGEAAICSKFERAATALENGADLVVELPVTRAVANAQRFAEGGVSIAKSFGCVSRLAFGCETDDLDLLQKAAYSFENKAVREKISELMKQGEYYPRAVQAAVSSVCGGDVASVLGSPNNILAVEYIRALKGTNITPVPVLRAGSLHDSHIRSGSIASASYIRGLLKNNEDASAYMPSVPSEITRAENLERAILYKLRTMTAEDFAALPDVGEGLENRIYEAVKKYNSVEEILSAVKTKRYTHARLRRVLICALLGITEETQRQNAEYVRVLGFNEEGSQMLKTCGSEVITSVAKYIRNNGEYSRILQAEIAATDTAALAYDNIKSPLADYLTKIIK
ncbi:MAG TPA: nucleotidyltransferase [Ruminococcaceae bacterium]|nr:nucleotidyltransferase [Oscillospiraceae bacterium]